jgi:hypothetical protein
MGGHSSLQQTQLAGEAGLKGGMCVTDGTQLVTLLLHCCDTGALWQPRDQ